MNITKFSFSILFKITKVLLFIILVLPLNGFSQSIIYVKHDAGGSNNGTSWANAYTSLQSALAIAASGDSIWVAAGTYKPSKDKTGNDPPTDARTKTFQLVNSVSLFGGFAGTETNFEDRDWKTNETILSGDLGTIDDMSDNCYNVVRGIDHSSIDGFTVTLGNANGPSPNDNDMGGGLSNINVSYVKSQNCIFKNNLANAGGGVANYFCGDSIIFKNCVFWADTADSGGGIGNWDTQANISQCSFLYNSADNQIGGYGYGGAIYNWGGGSTSKILNCTFYKNFGNAGAVIHNRGVGSSCTNSILWQNNGDNIINTNPGGGCSVSYCDIDQDAYSSGTGCFNSDPLIYIISEVDYRIHQSSPCIDTGNPSSPLDPDGSRADIGAAWTIFAPGIDLFVSEINSPPERFTLGEQEITVLIANHGLSTLTNVDIEWEVDGAPQTTKSWTGSLNSMDTSNVISLGNYDFIFGNHTIKAWTNNPTPGPDEYNGNDTSEISVYAVTNLDIGITSVVEPLNPFTFGLRDIRILFKNYSNDSTIISTPIEFEIDDVSQTTFDWTGNLLPGETSDTVTIKADHDFSETLHTIKVWTSDPNSNFDEDNTNDTLEVEANGCSPLPGDTLTIQASGGNFISFTEAVAYLTGSCGIEGPIVFLVESNTYNEQITIPEIPGTSETNTITFQSATGDSTDVILSNTGGGYTLALSGADYIIFKNMTISTDVDGNVISLGNGATYNQIMNCRIIGEAGSSNLIYLMDHLPNSYNIFSGNRLINGLYGICVHYRSTADVEIKDNVFIDQTDKAIRLDEVKGATITGNTITSNSTITGIYLSYCEDNFTIENNRISLMGGGSGIYWYGGNNNTGIPDRVVNNFIYINTSSNHYGIYNNSDHRDMDIIHNSIHITGNATGSSAIFISSSYPTFYVTNNILINKAGGKSIYYYRSDFTSDYNCLYSSGTYLTTDGMHSNGYETLEQHQNNTGQDMHSYSVDPQFVSDSDLHTFSPYLNNKGTPIAEILTDIDGEARDGTNPDIGADEYDPKPPLSGTYSIGPSDLFKTFNEAVDSLISVGIGGPVIFEVKDGSYNEQVSLPWIANSSEINTITFTSSNSDSTKVTLTYAASGESDNYTLKLDGADYIAFKDITIEAKGTEYARVVEIGYEAHGNTFSNNRFLGVLNKSELVYSYNSHDTCNVFENSVFSLGIRGINMISGSLKHGPSISGNEFINQTGEAIYLKWYKYPKILSNYIHSDYQSTSIYLDESREKVEVGNNKIILPNGGNGICLKYGFWGTTNDTSLIYNNFIYLNATNTGNPEYGIWLYSNNLGSKIMFNTIHITGDNSSSACLYYNSAYTDFRNNNLVNKAYGYAIYNEQTSNFYSDFNNPYSNGAKLTKYSTDLEHWQTTYNKDLNSVSVDPYFVVDTSQHILNPALNGAGTPFVEVGEDLDGDTRDANNPDIGADEFTPAPVPLSGIYTIAGTSPDYTTIYDAVKDLTINGVNGPVTFNIATDTLTEQVSIEEISGASETNTITFQSATGDSSDVLLTFTPINTAHKYTIRLDGADYIIFKKLSITTGEEWGWPIELKSEATHNIFEANKIFMAAQASKNVDYTLVYAKGSLDSNNVFMGNYFENGSIGIHLEDCAGGTQIENNKFINMSYQGVYLRNLINPKITGNYIDISTTSSSIQGILLYNVYSTGVEKGLVANNMIHINTSANSAYGIYISSSNDISIIYNTVKVNAETDNNTAFYGYGSGVGNHILNNIFVVNQGSYAAVLSDTTDCSIDYNLYYNPNSAYAEMYFSAGFTTDLEQYGFDLHSISREPVFVSDTDLHTTDPWMNNWGTPIAEVTTDIDGEARDAVKPDVGADEFDGIMPFEGEYTIGSTGDFESFTEAIDTITPVGISGPVTFKVQSGTYNEQIIVDAIPEVSENKTITFTSESGDSTDVILQFDATPGENYTVKMDSCSFITFRNMTIKAMDTTNARVVAFTKGASDNILSNNVLVGLGTTNAIVHSIGDQDNNNQFNYNLIKGGKIGIQMFGESASLLESGTKIIGNVFEDQFGEPILIKYNSAPSILNNQMIHNELITDTWAGIYLAECSGASNNYGLIANNIIAFNTEVMSAGIVLSGSSYQRVYFNSVNIYGTTNESRVFNQEDGGSNNHLKNNVFNNLSGGMVIYTRDINSFSSDYNNYYSTGDRFIYYGPGTEFYWISDLATWQTDYSKDINSYSVDPKFVSNTNLIPANIILDRSGVVLAEVTEDFAGNQRDPVNPDIGAYEFYGCTNSGTFTIGASGADYTTFEEAIESLQTCWADGPIIFNVQSGTYNEQVIIPEVPGASETNTITFQSVSGDSTDVILTFESTSADTNYTVKFDGADYFRFKNLTIQATGNDYAKVIELNNGASNNQFHNNRFIGVTTTSDALVFSPLGSVYDTNTVFNENLFLSGSYGIYLSSYYTYPETNNQITKNRFENQVSYGMYLLYQDSALISMNEISNTLSEKDYYGIYFHGINSQINKNKINLNNLHYRCIGVNIDGWYPYTKPNFLSNNFVHISTNGSQSVIGLELSKCCYSYYNSVNITGNNTGSYGILLPTATQSCSLKNNISVNNAGGYSIGYNDDSSDNVSSDYNDLFSNGDYLGKYNGTNLVDLAEWTTATTFDANTVSVDPVFVTDTDLHTQNPVINGSGTPVTEVADDIDGEPRDAATPDIGADEFAQSIYVLGNDIINACAYDTVTLDAGNEYDSYSWSNGAATRFTDVDTAGVGLDSIKLVSTVTLGGQEYKDSLWISFHKPVAVTFDIDTCEYNYVQLKASGGVSYHWEPYVTNPDTCCVSVYLYSTTQDWVVTVYDSYGCYDMDTATVVPYSKPLQPVIQFSNDSLVSSVTGTNYNWFLNSTTTGNITQAIKPQESGDYQVIVYNGGCPSDSSSSYNYIVGIEDIAGNREITLYPNPTDGKLFMSFEKPFKDLRLSVINMEGQVVFSRLLDDVPKGFVTELDLGDVPSGVYFVRFTNKEISRTARIIVR